jgi:glucose-1-phosphate thymidylyltransferase
MLPLTKITNKHLLPVFNKPMIYYPIQTLVDAGIEDILLVTGGNYTYQEGEGGIAEALGLAEYFAAGEKIVVILGDNLLQQGIKKAVDNFQRQEKGAKILLKEVSQPQRFGVAEISGDRIVSIEEKPEAPKSNFIVTGFYMYDSQVFDIVKTLKPSTRGELEITDVNNAYIEQGTMTFEILEGWWTDAGTFESLYNATCLIADKNL